MRYRGAGELRSLIDSYQSTRAADIFGTVEALHFAEFLSTQWLSIPFLDEVFCYEYRLLDCQVRGNPAIVTFEHEPTMLLEAIAAGERLHDVPVGSWSFSISTESGAEQSTRVVLRLLSDIEAFGTGKRVTNEYCERLLPVYQYSPGNYGNG